MSGTIRIENADAVRTVTLDRPEKRNALTLGMLEELALSFQTGPGTRAVLVRGEGRAFCAGFDLTQAALGGEDEAVLGSLRALVGALSDSVRAMRACPAPIVLAAHGAAVAGGAALLGGADVVVTDARAKVGYPVLRLGISPAVSVPFLRAGVGDGGARAMTLDPTLITGERAHALGLAHELVAEQEMVGERAETIARSIASKPATGIMATKRWVARLDGVHGADTGLAASEDSLGTDTIERLSKEIWSR